MVGSELPKHLLTHLHVVMRHVEHMACGMKQNDSGGRSKDLGMGRRGCKRQWEKQESPAVVFKLAISTVSFVDVLQTLPPPPLGCELGKDRSVSPCV